MDARTPSGTAWDPPPDRRDWDADTAVSALYPAHYRYLVRTAALLVCDAATGPSLPTPSEQVLIGRVGPAPI